MSTVALYSKIELLPEHLKQHVLEYIEFLLSREVTEQTLTAVRSQNKGKSDALKPLLEDTEGEPLFARTLHTLLSQNPSFHFLAAAEEDIYSDADLKVKY